MKAMICDKWEYQLYVSLEDESERSKKKRTYLHYLSEHVELVSAKCAATEWLMSGVPRGLSVREYFGGAGVVSAIIQGLLAPRMHIATDRDKRCVQQLQGLLGASNSFQADAKKAILSAGDDVDMHLLDYPSFTILGAMGAWKGALDRLFSSGPRYIVITDTACSYLGVHRGRYGEAFGGVRITDKRDYTAAVSQYLMATYGFSIHRVAYRHSNASYYLCSQGTGAMEESSFAKDGCGYGFKFI